MANLSGHTAIYIRTTGNDDTGDGSAGNPYATSQKGYDVAAATASGNYVLDFGAGSFSGIILAGNWPSRIAIRGAGAALSSVGGIVGTGADLVWDFENNTELSPATAGRDVTINSDGTIQIGSVNCGGGYSGYSGNAAPGGNIALTDCVVLEGVSTDGGDAVYPNGSAYGAGNITLTGCTIGGGATAIGGSSGFEWLGSGGAVNITNSSCGVIDASAGQTGYKDYNSFAGSVTLIGSTVGNVIALGATNIDSQDTPGDGGSVSATDSVLTGSINVSGGTAPGSIYSTTQYGAPGSVTLIGSTNIPNSISGATLTTTNLRKGRGVNGSSILGIA